MTKFQISGVSGHAKCSGKPPNLPRREASWGACLYLYYLVIDFSKAEKEKSAATEDMLAVSERLIKQNMEAYETHCIILIRLFACNYYTANSPVRMEISCEKATVLLTYDKTEITLVDGSKEDTPS